MLRQAERPATTARNGGSASLCEPVQRNGSMLRVAAARQYGRILSAVVPSPVVEPRCFAFRRFFFFFFFFFFFPPGQTGPATVTAIEA